MEWSLHARDHAVGPTCVPAAMTHDARSSKSERGQATRRPEQAEPSYVVVLSTGLRNNRNDARVSYPPSFCLDIGVRAA